MQHSWLVKKNNKSCIVLMTGWGTDGTPFSAIAGDNIDCLVISDYRTLAPLDTSIFKQYETLHLLSWSMGVWVAGHILKEERELFATRTAVAGTLDPIDDRHGIPVKNYNSMVQSFNRAVLLDFQDSMFDDISQRDQFHALRPNREIHQIHEELICFQDHFQRHGIAEDIYTNKIVTTRDRVFPLKNQIRCWGKENTKIIKQPHFPFYSSPTLLDFLCSIK